MQLYIYPGASAYPVHGSHQIHSSGDRSPKLKQFASCAVEPAEIVDPAGPEETVTRNSGIAAKIDPIEYWNSTQRPPHSAAAAASQLFSMPERYVDGTESCQQKAKPRSLLYDEEIQV